MLTASLAKVNHPIDCDYKLLPFALNMLLSRRSRDSSIQFQSLRRWCKSALGRRLVEVEEQELSRELHRIFGYHLVLVDPCCPMESIRVSRILHQVIQSSLPGEPEQAVSLVAKHEQMPWQTDSVDAFILPHVLEHSSNPHQTLRELDRCLVAEGHLIILGFNPWGLWGWRRFLSLGGTAAPWSLRFIGMAKLKDWLSLLGYDMVETRYYFSRLPWLRESKAGRFSWLDRLQRPRWSMLAACYLLVARKRIVTLTPIKPRWRPRRSLVAGGVVETQQRGLSRHGQG